MKRAIILAYRDGGELLLGARDLAWPLVLGALLSVLALVLIGNSDLSLLWAVGSSIAG